MQGAFMLTVTKYQFLGGFSEESTGSSDVIEVTTCFGKALNWLKLCKRKLISITNKHFNIQYKNNTRSWSNQKIE